EGELQRLPPRHPQGAAAIERPVGEEQVADERGVEREGTEVTAPEQDEPLASGQHRVDRDEAERVVEEVGGEVGEQHETQPEARLPDDGRPRAGHRHGADRRRYSFVRPLSLSRKPPSARLNSPGCSTFDRCDARHSTASSATGRAAWMSRAISTGVPGSSSPTITRAGQRTSRRRSVTLILGSAWQQPTYPAAGVRRIM